RAATPRRSRLNTSPDRKKLAPNEVARRVTSPSPLGRRVKTRGPSAATNDSSGCWGVPARAAPTELTVARTTSVDTATGTQQRAAIFALRSKTVTLGLRSETATLGLRSETATHAAHATTTNDVIASIHV